MKTKALLVLVLLCFTQPYFSQQKIIDSLEQQIVKPTNDKTKLENLIDLGNGYAYVNPNKGLERLKEALLLALEINDSIKIGAVYSETALNYKQLGKDSLAHINYNNAISIFKKIGLRKNIAVNKYNKSLIYISKSDFKEALPLLNDALNIHEKEKDTIQICLTLGIIGYSYCESGKYKASLKSYLKSSNLFRKIGKQNSLQYATMTTNMAILYQRLKQYRNSISKHNEAISIYKKNNNQYFLSIGYINLGSIFQEQKKYYKAISMFNKSASYQKKVGDVYQLVTSYSNLGNSYNALKNTDLSITYIDSALYLSRKHKNFTSLATNFNNKGEAFFIQEKYRLAKVYLDSANTIIANQNVIDKRLIHIVKRSLAKIEYKLGNYKKAYKFLDKARKLNDSLINDTKKEEIAVLKAQYEFDNEKEILQANFKRDQAIEQSKTEKEKTIRNISIVAFSIVLVFLTFGFFLWRKKQKAEYVAALSGYQLQSLKAQMNPHFVYNSLNSINDFVLKNEKAVASNYLSRFSAMMRRILENTEEEDISLAEELNFLKDYVALEQERVQNKFMFSIDIHESIEPSTTFVPPSLLQLFIENSIWHGISEKKDGKIALTFTTTNEYLVCTITDNGKGIQKSNTNPLRKSFAIENVKSRLLLLNQSKDVKTTFSMKNNPIEGVTVILKLPIIIEN